MMGGGHIPGVIPLAVEDVFETIKNVIHVFLFTCLKILVHILFFSK